MLSIADQDLVDALRAIKLNGELPASDWPLTALSPDVIGLSCTSEMLHWGTEPDRLDAASLRLGVPTSEIEIFEVIDSTNTQLLAKAQETNPATRLYLAEFQSGGRGRRGRTWLSPYARNLSMSLGQRTEKQLNQLGGLSLVIGLALIDALHALGVSNAGLKWPNDVLVNGEKISGVLVELAALEQGAYVVIGMGVNVQLTDAERALIGQPVTDLRSCGVQQNRTELVITFIQHVLQSLEQFERQGFEPFIERFNQQHVFHGKDCRILQGDSTFEGKVTGVGSEGELILATSAGERRFHGGEVSLRAASV